MVIKYDDQEDLNGCHGQLSHLT